MDKVNHSLKARMYIGGLKSLFGDMHDMIVEIEKTGNVPAELIANFLDVKEAIDLTIDQLKRTAVPCCDHADHPHSECDEDCVDGGEEDDEVLYCEDCDQRCEDCECDTDEDDDEEEPPPPPPKKPSAKKVSAKNVDNKVVIPAKKKGK